MGRGDWILDGRYAQQPSLFATGIPARNIFKYYVSCKLTQEARASAAKAQKESAPEKR